MELNLNVNRNIYKASNVNEFNEDFRESLLKYQESYQGPSKCESLISYMKKSEKPILMQFINTVET